MDQLSGLLLPLAFLAVLWFLLIRPQQKRQREHKQMVKSVEVGDDVITAGGVHGRVVILTDETMDLEVTDDIVLRFQRAMLSRVLREEDELEESSGS